MSRPAAVFALYRGDRFIDLGTAKELEERTGIKPSTIRRACKAFKIRDIKRGLIAIRIDDE